MEQKLPCVIMRGGTSKGVFFHRSDLPEDPQRRDAVLLAVMGSPDPRQVDGLGGADPLTSKVAIIAPSERGDVDVEYTFAQVALDEAQVAYTNTCGNIVSAVGPFAVDEGLVEAVEPVTRVRILDTNTDSLVLADVPVAKGRARSDGRCSIDGVPGMGAEIRLTFVRPEGAVTGRLLPTGRRKERLELSDGPVDVSIVDAGTLYVFVAAESFGLSGSEPADELERHGRLLDAAAEIRQRVAQGLADAGVIGADLARNLRRSLKVTLFGSAHGSGPGLSARILNPGRVHKAYAVTGAIAAGAAAFIPGTNVNERVLPPVGGGRLWIEHPSGRMEVALDVQSGAELPVIAGATVVRTARRIMEGSVHLPASGPSESSARNAAPAKAGKRSTAAAAHPAG